MMHLQSSDSKKHSLPSEEQVLLAKLAQGDTAVVWQLWALHHDYLYYRCLNWLGGNHFDAEDIMSIAAIKAWHKLPKYAHEIVNLKAWLNRFVHNLCVDFHRQRSRRAVRIKNACKIAADNRLAFSSSSGSPESTLLQQELKIYLRYCVEDLAPRLRQPVVMFYYQEMSYADIAERLMISQDNLAKRLQQARQILKRHLQKYYSGLDIKAINEAQLQQLAQQDFSAPANLNLDTEEINYQITISCLETLSPEWCRFPQTQAQISMPI